MSPPANLSHEKEFDLHENESVSGTHFHMNGFAQRLGLAQSKRQLRNGLLHWTCYLRIVSGAII